MHGAVSLTQVEFMSWRPGYLIALWVRYGDDMVTHGDDILLTHLSDNAFLHGNCLKQINET